MASKLAEMKCCFCGKIIDEPEYIEIDDTGDLIACCSDCYKTADLLVRGRVNERKSKFSSSNERPE